MHCLSLLINENLDERVSSFSYQPKDLHSLNKVTLRGMKQHIKTVITQQGKNGLQISEGQQLGEIFVWGMQI